MKSDCAFCEEMRRSLHERGTEYEEVNIEKQRAAVPELLKLTKGERIVPVLVDAAGIHVAPEGGSPF